MAKFSPKVALFLIKRRDISDVLNFSIYRSLISPYRANGGMQVTSGERSTRLLVPVIIPDVEKHPISIEFQSPRAL